MSSTIESMRQLEEAAEELERSGLREYLEQRTKGRIQTVVDSSNGKRNFRNLWGLLPVKRMELMKWDDGGSLLTESTRVAGIRIPDSELGELGEMLIDKVFNSLEVDASTSKHTEERKKGIIVARDEFKIPGSAVELHRIALRADRGGEFVPGFPATYRFVWHAVQGTS